MKVDACKTIMEAFIRFVNCSCMIAFKNTFLRTDTYLFLLMKIDIIFGSLDPYLTAIFLSLQPYFFCDPYYSL